MTGPTHLPLAIDVIFLDYHDFGQARDREYFCPLWTPNAPFWGATSPDGRIVKP